MTQNLPDRSPGDYFDVGAMIVSRVFEAESIDTYRLAREGKTLHIGRERRALTQIPVTAVMSREVTTVAENTALDDVLRIAGETSQSTLPVVSSDGVFNGLIVTRDLLALLIRDEQLSPLINAYDLCDRHPPLLTARRQPRSRERADGIGRSGRNSGRRAAERRDNFWAW